MSLGCFWPPNFQPSKNLNFEKGMVFLNFLNLNPFLTIIVQSLESCTYRDHERGFCVGDKDEDISVEAVFVNPFV